MIFQVGDVLTSIAEGDFIIQEIDNLGFYLIKFKNGSTKSVVHSFLYLGLARNEINFKSYSNNIKPKHWVESKFYF